MKAASSTELPLFRTAGQTPLQSPRNGRKALAPKRREFSLGSYCRMFPQEGPFRKPQKQQDPRGQNGETLSQSAIIRPGCHPEFPGPREPCPQSPANGGHSKLGKPREFCLQSNGLVVPKSSLVLAALSQSPGKRQPQQIGKTSRALFAVQRPGSPQESPKLTGPGPNPLNRAVTAGKKNLESSVCRSTAGSPPSVLSYRGLLSITRHSCHRKYDIPREFSLQLNRCSVQPRS